MGYSEQGYRIACELVLPRLLEALESVKPGTAQQIIDDVAAQASHEAEKTGDRSLIEALQIAAGWEKGAITDAEHTLHKLQGQVDALGSDVSVLIDRVEELIPGTAKYLHQHTFDLFTDLVSKHPQLAMYQHALYSLEIDLAVRNGRLTSEGVTERELARNKEIERRIHAAKT